MTHVDRKQLGAGGHGKLNQRSYVKEPTNVLYNPHQNDQNRQNAVCIRRYNSFVESVKNVFHRGKTIYLKFLEKRFPTLYGYQMQILNGALGLKRDAFIWARMVGEMKTGKRLSSYSKTQLMAYLEISQQKIKAVPIVFITMLPFSVMFLPLLFNWPGIFLTSHFMSEAQRTSVELDKLEHKLIYCERVLDDFALKVEKLPTHTRARKAAEEIINKMHLAHCNELRIKNMTKDSQIQFLINKAMATSAPSALTDSELKWYICDHMSQEIDSYVKPKVQVTQFSAGAKDDSHSLYSIL
uniref:Letm1 RBD domain-containing protein n=1 Tax=Magallana gigas TaxID=29159 RepID=K1R937_MAGGI